MHRRFFEGLLKQVKVMHDQRTFTRNVQEYMDMRRGTIGAYPAIALTEYDISPSFLYYSLFVLPATKGSNECVDSASPDMLSAFSFRRKLLTTPPFRSACVSRQILCSCK